MRGKNGFGCRKLSRVSGRKPDWQEFIFLRNRERLLPKNAILTYMPSKLIEDGETSRPLHFEFYDICGNYLNFTAVPYTRISAAPCITPEVV